MARSGYVALLLHAHLPYVRHPEYEDFLEEKWFYEAVIEVYLPLLEMLRRLEHDRVPCALTVSITPPLAGMLQDPLLMRRFEGQLDRLIELAEKEVQRTRWQPKFNNLARMYEKQFKKAKDLYQRLGGDILDGFLYFQDQSRLEIIASAATHGYLPLMIHREAQRAQIKTGIESYRRAFGWSPQGFWLPECGYTPGVEELLAEEDIEWFIIDSHGLLHARPRPRYAVYAPAYTPSHVAVFGRDWESSKQVWSADEGYPGDYDYREFYRDIGYDLDWDYVRPYVSGGVRNHTGIKYYRITGKTEDKVVYDPTAAREKAAIHAGNFMFNREKQIEYLADNMDRPPIVVAPYDAELFGHWWYEGPLWLEYVIRKSAYDQSVFELTTPTRYLADNPRLQVVQPVMSSWGHKGYNEVWLEGSNDWIYRHLHKASERMVELASSFPTPSELERRALNQAARELLLAQSSDWAFIMKTGTMVPYAVARTKMHINRFTELYEQLRSRSVDERRLAYLESTDNIFPEMDYSVYQRIGSEKAGVHAG